MTRLLFLVVFLAGALQMVSAQTSLLHPGQICCTQDLCPNEPLPLITETLATTPLDTVIQIEYKWSELILDASAPNGARWRVIEGQNGRNFQPTAINNPFGGFFMRSAREIGSLVFLNSNIVNYRILPATDQACVSATDQQFAEQQVVLAPNPASDLLHVMVQRDAGLIMDVEIFDLAGRAVWSQRAVQNEVVAVPVRDFQNGIYIARIRLSDGQFLVRKWVKGG
jgi:hypothetical protein